MITKKDVRDWMIEHKVYDDVDDVDESLQRNGDDTLRILSCSFNNNEGKFDRYFETIGGKTYNSLPDEPELSYLDILDRL